MIIALSRAELLTYAANFQKMPYFAASPNEGLHQLRIST